MRRARLLAPCVSVLLFTAVLIGCGSDDSPTSPKPPAKTVWHVPADLPTIAAAADTAEQGHEIVVAPGVYLEHGIVLDVGVDLRGESGKAADVVIDGQGLGRVLAVQLGDSTVVQPGDTTSVITDLVITGGAGDGEGGGLLAELRTEVRNVRFLANTASGPGGGVHARYADVRLVSCALDSNRTETIGRNGGGLAVTAGGVRRVEVDSCYFTGNVATGSGGGAFVGLADLRLAHSTFDGNRSETAGYYGGGLAYEGFSNLVAVVDTCTFNGNTAEDIGGGASCRGPASFTGCVFDGNSARQGGAMMPGSTYAVTGCRFTNNEATVVGGDDSSGLGGALFQLRGQGAIDCEFQGNTSGSGSAIFSNSGTTVQDCVFTGNTATASGTVYWTGDAALRFERCEFSTNTAGTGGAFRIAAGVEAVFVDCLFAENTAGAAGAGEIIQATAELDSCTVTANTVSAYGGAFMVENFHGGAAAALVLDDCTVTGNDAGAAGGAVFLGMNAELAATDTDLRGNTSPDGPAAFVGGECTAIFTCCDVLPEEIHAIGTVTHITEGCGK